MLTRTLAVAIALAALAAPAAASAAWTAPTDLSAAGGDAHSAQVAIDAAGDAIAVWTRFDGANWRVQSGRQSAAGVLSPVDTLSDLGETASMPEVAADLTGDAVAVWQAPDGIKAREVPAFGLPGPVLDVSTVGDPAWEPQVAVDASGGVLVLWGRGTQDQGGIAEERRPT